MAAGVRPKKIGKVNLFKIDWTGKEKKETSPTYNISGEIDGINEPFDKGGFEESNTAKDDDLPF